MSFRRPVQSEESLCADLRRYRTWIAPKRVNRKVLNGRTLTFRGWREGCYRKQFVDFTQASACDASELGHPLTQRSRRFSPFYTSLALHRTFVPHQQIHGLIPISLNFILLHSLS